MDFIQAISEEGYRVHAFASRQARYIPDSTTRPEWHVCCAWLRLLIPDGYRARNWGGRADTLIRNLEFLLCISAAKRGHHRAGSSRHIHCIESRHRLLLRSVLNSNLTFSTLCVGEPNHPMSEDTQETYKRAFATGRLTFIVETEAVAKSWQALAGKHVIHIPAALPWTKHHPIDKNKAREKFGLPASAFICLFFGTHREGKDYRLAIEAAKASESQPYLLFVGPLISSNNPRIILDQVGYGHAASWESYFPDDDVPELFDACDVVMLPYSENYVKGSAVLLQACHFKKPVIATNTGHLKEFVSENQIGKLFDVGSMDSLANCYDEMATLRANGQLEERFKFTNIFIKHEWKNLIKIYSSIVTEPCM
jgi:glycosyltransferase involved in cell wall biosynthesis